MGSNHWSIESRGTSPPPVRATIAFRDSSVLILRPPALNLRVSSPPTPSRTIVSIVTFLVLRSQYLLQSLSRRTTRPSTQSHNRHPQGARVNLSDFQGKNRKNHFITRSILAPLTQNSSQIATTISTRWPEPNASPARRSAHDHQQTPLKTTRARARLPSKTTTTATCLLRST